MRKPLKYRIRAWRPRYGRSSRWESLRVVCNRDAADAFVTAFLAERDSDGDYLYEDLRLVQGPRVIQEWRDRQPLALSEQSIEARLDAIEKRLASIESRP